MQLLFYTKHNHNKTCYLIIRWIESLTCAQIYSAFMWIPSESHLCSPRRTMVSVTRHTCWCSVCCAVWVSYSVWPHQWLWSGQAYGWPKNCTTICSIKWSLPQWGTSKPSYSWSVYVECYCILCIICHDWVTMCVGMY